MNTSSRPAVNPISAPGDKSRKYTDALLCAAMAKITAELNRINDLRSKNRTITIVFVGAILGYSIEKADVFTAVFLSIAAMLVVLCQAWQEYILHKYQHGWHGVDRRTRSYIQRTLDDDCFTLLEYKKEDEKKAERFSKTSGWIFVLLFLGSAGVLFLKLVGVGY